MIVLGGWLSADVGTGTDNGFLETIAQLVRERLVGDTQRYAAIVCDKIRGEVHGTVEDDGGGPVSYTHLTLPTNREV